MMSSVFYICESCGASVVSLIECSMHELKCKDNNVESMEIVPADVRGVDQ